MNRRGFLTALVVATAGCNVVGRQRDRRTETATGTATPSGPTSAPATDTGTTTEPPPRLAVPGPRIRLEPVATGLQRPVALQTPPGGGNRSYVIGRLGEVLALDRTTGQTAVVLDLVPKLTELRSWEQGVLGIAFHPAFESNRKLYLRYSAPLRKEAPDGFSHTFVLSEFRVSESGRTIDPSSERMVLEIPEPGPIHNGGGIAFGPDGLLHVGVGDGGGGHYDQGPGHVEDWYEAVKGGNGQDLTENLLGSILRIDVDDRTDGKPYGVPEDNPLVGRSGLDEQYAWGFRNPYRLAFWDGDLLVGDVGQDSYEELDHVEKGGNYGWNVREGPRCVKRETCPFESPRGNPLRDPVLAYEHREPGTGPTSVIGGYPYANGAVAALADTYVFGDFFTDRYGHLFVARRPDSAGGSWGMEELVVANAPGGRLREAILGFGTDEDGNVYVLTTRFRERSGSVYRIAPAN